MFLCEFWLWSKLGWAETPLNLSRYVLCRPTKLGADRDKIMSVRPIFTVRTAFWNLGLVQRHRDTFSSDNKKTHGERFPVRSVWVRWLCFGIKYVRGMRLCCSLFAVRERLWARGCVCQAVVRVFRRFIIRLTADIQSFHVGFITWQGSCRQGLF